MKPIKYHEYICTSTRRYTAEIEKTSVPNIIEKLTSEFAKFGLVRGGENFKPSLNRQTEIYYDAQLANNTLKTLLFYGGFCRQIFVENLQTQGQDIYVDFKSVAGSKEKRFKLDVPAKALQIKNKLEIEFRTFRTVAKADVQRLVIPFIKTDENGKVVCVFNLYIETDRIENVYEKQPKDVVFVYAKMPPEFARYYKKNYVKSLGLDGFDLAFMHAMEDLEFAHAKQSNKYEAMFENYFKDLYEKSVYLPF